MAFRQTFEEYKVKDYADKERVFRINKMNPLEGIAVLKEMLTRTLPIDLMSIAELKGVSLSSMFGDLQMDKKSMGIDEFIKLQERLLKNVQEMMPAGAINLLDDRGNFQSSDIENDMLLITKLLGMVLKVNYKDFFIDILQTLTETGILEKMEATQSQGK